MEVRAPSANPEAREAQVVRPTGTQRKVGTAGTEVLEEPPALGVEVPEVWRRVSSSVREVQRTCPGIPLQAGRVDRAGSVERLPDQVSWRPTRVRREPSTRCSVAKTQVSAFPVGERL
jgi:hypothetical protein